MVKIFSRRLLYVIVGIVAAALVAIGIPIAAEATTAITYTLHVTTQSGAALTGYGVTVLNPVNGDQPDTQTGAATPTGKAGYWNVSGQSDTAYTLHFTQTGSISGEPYSEFLGGTTALSDAETYTAVNGETLSLTLDTSSTISGTVLSPTGHAVKGEIVSPFRYSAGQWSEDELPTTTTNSSGKYTLDETLPGSYELMFHDPSTSGYLDSYSGNVAVQGAAIPFYVSPTEKATQNAKLIVGGRLAGRVLIDNVSLPAHTPQPSDQVRAWAVPLVGTPGSFTSADTADAVEGSESDSKGDYTIGGLDIYGGVNYYAVELVPDESLKTGAQYVGGGSVWTSVDNYFTLQNDTVITVPTTTITSSTAASVEFSITAGGTVPAGTVVELTRLGDPGDISAAETESTSGLVGIADIAPGEYEYIVSSKPDDPYYNPYDADVYLAAGNNTVNVSLDSYIAPGFSAVPKISPSSAAIGTEYSVSPLPNQTETITYQWLRNGVAIYGATASTYQSGSADYGTTVSVRMRAFVLSEEPYDYVAYVNGSSSGTETTGAEVANVDAPSFTPSTGLVPGTVLHASPGTWNVNGASYGYYWTSSRPGAGLYVATGSSYTVTPQDAGYAVGLFVEANAAHFTSGGIAETSTSPVAYLSAPTPKTAPKAKSKTLSDGDIQYTITHATWSVSGVSYSDDWELDNVVTPLTSGVTTFTVPAADAAKTVEVLEKAQKAGYTTSDWAIDVAHTGTEAVSVTGTPEVQTTASVVITSASTPVNPGTELEPKSNSWTATWADTGTSPDSVSSQWYSQDGSAKPAAISHAATVEYAPTTSEVGRKLSVVVTEKRAGYRSAVITIPAGTVAADPALVNQPATLVIAGSGSEGTKLTADLGAWPVGGVDAKYQWVLCGGPAASDCSGDDIPGATKSTFTPTTATVPASSYVSVVVTGTKTDYQPEAVTAPPISVVTDNAPTALTTPSWGGGITAGAAHVGVRLSISHGTYDVANVHLSWVWQTCLSSADCSDGSSWHTAQGSDPTASTYTPVAADYSSSATTYIRVLQTATAPTASTPVTYVLSDYALDPGTLTRISAPKLTTKSSSYTVTGGGWSPTATTAVDWWRGDTQVSASFDTATYTRSSSDDGLPVYAVVHVVENGYLDPAYVVVAQKGDAPTDSVSLVGNTYGDYLQALSTPTFGAVSVPVTSTQSFAWSAAPYGSTKYKSVSGEHLTAWVPGVSYVEDTMEAVVTVSSNLFATKSFAAFPASEDPAAAPTTSGTASITVSGGLAAPGHVLTAVAPSYSPTVTQFGYGWQYAAGGGWETFAGATKSTFTIPSDFVTAEIRVEVSSDLSGHLSTSTDSPGLTIVDDGTLLPLTQPSITGTGEAGDPLTLNTGSWNYSGVGFLISWQQDGVTIPGANGTTFTPEGDSVGTTITATLEPLKLNYYGSDVDTSGVTITQGAAPKVVTAPKISVTSGSSRLVSVTDGAWNAGGLTFSYSWTVAGSPVDGDTDSISIADDIAGVISVTITASKDGFAVGTVIETKTVAAVS